MADERDSVERTFARAQWKAVLGILLAGVLAAIMLACILARAWVAGGFLGVLVVPMLVSAVRGLRRARQGGLVVTARGLLDHALPCGWIAWSDVKHLSWNALTSTVTLHLKPNRIASKRLNAETPTAGTHIPDRIVLHTATLTISRFELVQLIERRAPLSVRPSESLYMGDF